MNPTSIYLKLSSLAHARKVIAAIRERAAERGVQIIEITPSGDFGFFESEEAILENITKYGVDPTTCVKALMSGPIGLQDLINNPALHLAK